MTHISFPTSHMEESKRREEQKGRGSEGTRGKEREKGGKEIDGDVMEQSENKNERRKEYFNRVRRKGREIYFTVSLQYIQESISKNRYAIINQIQEYFYVTSLDQDEKIK